MDRVAIILAEMLRSALDWEQDNGYPAQRCREDELTGMQKANILPPLEIRKVGVRDDHQDHKAE
ncbi:hypothetical protein ACFLVW_02575 [Chloroflexota bacterium]